MRHIGRTRFILTVIFTFLLGDTAPAFIITVNPSNQAPLVPWTSTASGFRSNNGEPVTLTWSLVPDGTTILSNFQNPSGGSDLISYLNTNFDGDPLEDDLTQQPWFEVFEQSFDRWGQLSGATYVYEPNDNGGVHGSGNGQLGVRGDIRIGGISIDGENGVLAYNALPDDGGDMVLDTDEVTFFTNSAGDHIRLRNTIMHEHGHGFGLLHVVSNTDNLLLEPSISIGFDGPQLDEIRAIQFYFGDAFEASHDGQGNATAALAVDLGDIAIGDTARVGADGDVSNQFIRSSATDFVSISNASDVDFFSFRVPEPSQLDAVLTPLGGTFNQGSQLATPTPFDAFARSNLALTVFDTDGESILASADETGLGGTESLGNVSLPAAGDYFAQVTGADDTIQLYMLELSVSAFPFVRQPGDANQDRKFDSLDIVEVLAAGKYDTGLPATWAEGDWNGAPRPGFTTGPPIGDGFFDSSDIIAALGANLFEAGPYAASSLSAGEAISAVPEPSGLFLAMMALLMGGLTMRRSR